MTAGVLNKQSAIDVSSIDDGSHWTKLQVAFVTERVRNLLQLSPHMVRAHVRDLVEVAPLQLVAHELASTIYLVVNTPESNSLDVVMHTWEALDLPTRRYVREAFQKKFGGTIRSVLGHRLPAHIQAALSW